MLNADREQAFTGTLFFLNPQTAPKADSDNDLTAEIDEPQNFVGAKRNRSDLFYTEDGLNGFDRQAKYLAANDDREATAIFRRSETMAVSG
jgi:hypothetical protein